MEVKTETIMEEVVEDEQLIRDKRERDNRRKSMADEGRGIRTN